MRLLPDLYVYELSLVWATAMLDYLYYGAKTGEEHAPMLLMGGEL